MVDNISWNSYWLFILLSTLIYYFFVVAVYFRNDLFKPRIRNFGLADANSFQTTPLTPQIKEVKENDSTEASENLIKSLVDEIRAFLIEAGKSKEAKERILEGLRQICSKYSKDQIEIYKTAITNLIETECYDKCIIRLSVDELEQVWVYRRNPPATLSP